MEEFGEKLKLSVFGLDAQRDINSDIVTHEELLEYFGKRSSYGWKVKMSDLLNVEDCSKFLKLYEFVFAQPFINGDYSSIFLKGWLAHKKGHPNIVCLGQ
jgi:hypothetical protein